MKKHSVFSSNTSARDELPDVIRGIAIFLVLFAHCIQVGSGSTFRENSLYFQDRLYQFIYSFHMPLFMLIAGFYAYSGIDRACTSKSIPALIRKKAAAYILPVLLWTVVEFIRLSLINGLKGLSAGGVFGAFIYTFVSGYWFMWAVFFCFSAMLFLYRVFFLKRKHGRILLTAGSVFLLLLFLISPDGLFLGPSKYLFPFYETGFCAAVFCSDAEKKESFLRALSRPFTLIGSLFVFAVLFFFYNSNDLIYTTGFKIIGKDISSQIGIDLYRTLIGYAACLTVLSLLMRLKERKKSPAGSSITAFSAEFGRMSKGIYLTSQYVVIFLILPAADVLLKSTGIAVRINLYLLNAAETAVAAAICFAAVKLLSGNRILKYLV